MLFKRFLIWSSGGLSIQWSGTIYVVLKEGIMGNIHVKLYEIWTSGSGDVIERKSLRTTDGRRTKTDDTSSHSSFGFFSKFKNLYNHS